MLSPDVHELVTLAAKAASAKKAFEIVGLEVSELTSMADVFLLCSGGGARQVHAIADEIRRRLKPHTTLLHSEGEGTSEWVLIDYGALVVHVLTEERRSYYALDRLWGDATRMELADGGSSDPTE